MDLALLYCPIFKRLKTSTDYLAVYTEFLTCVYDHHAFFENTTDDRDRMIVVEIFYQAMKNLVGVSRQGTYHAMAQDYTIYLSAMAVSRWIKDDMQVAIPDFARYLADLIQVGK
ncbi:hypothetical protein [Limosilactobacillus kribbianus]|uniref:hypothetical protein n=1 Tax=Limosilactobacillus kribbianus TaxID=2982695 RepID=UPI002264B796|nr:hypothetical protein [Limosilactobacillus kribbianus]